MEHEPTFYKSQITNRWWMEVPEQKTVLIACSQDEYQQASNHDIPEPWWRTQRINWRFLAIFVKIHKRNKKKPS